MLGIAEDESECAAYLCVLYYCTGAMQRPRTSTSSAALSCLGERESVGTDEVSIEKNNALWLIRTPLLYWTLPGNGSPRMDESSSRIICRLTVVGPKIESPTSALTPLHRKHKHSSTHGQQNKHQTSHHIKACVCSTAPHKGTNHCPFMHWFGVAMVTQAGRSFVRVIAKAGTRWI